MKKMAWLVAAFCVAGGLCGCEKLPDPLKAEDVRVKPPEMPDVSLDGAGRSITQFDLKVIDNQSALYDARRKAAESVVPAAVAVATPAAIPAATATAPADNATTTPADGGGNLPLPPAGGDVPAPPASAPAAP